ncbi:MAG: carboxylase [Desulfobacterales bacterium CG23_combo_of_CG06-09_8_20_14_all_51_8]|nr:MAG: carboxylase [Desulfobacterales bacterium CG23_combo_of_CG06-09_8_20_14_all_51_8]
MSDHFKVKMQSINDYKNRPKADNPVKIQDLTLRDGHESLFASRGRTEDMIPIAEMMDEVGFWGVEVWGGATFDTMHRFLNEDPWQRLRTLKRYFKKTPFSMLLRGQNVVGYRNYGDDVALAFVEKAAENGIDIFRTFDALNDFRNFETVVAAIKDCGKHFQGCICYSLTEPRMGGDVYNLDYYLDKAKDLEKMQADSICIKDMAGLMAPYDAFELIKALKENTDIPIHLHSHFTSGMAPMTHLKAVEAGVDVIDTCMSSYAYRTSHPAVEPLVMSLIGTSRDTGFDMKKLAEINVVLEKEVLPKYKHLLDDSKVSIIDINALLHQIPGGMLSNLVNQLREMDALDRMDEVFAELPRVRRDLGQIPLVTPTSQIVGTQTVNNVLFDDGDEDYKMITAQVKDLCYGLYGKTAVPISSKLQKKALKGYERGTKPITCRPGEVVEPELEKARNELKGLTSDLEDILLYTLYPVTGKKFLMYKYEKETPPDSLRPRTLEDVKKADEILAKAKAGTLVEKSSKDAPAKGKHTRTFNVFIEDEYFEVSVDEPGGQPIITYAQPPVAPAAPAIPSQALAAPRVAVSPALRPAPPSPAPKQSTPSHKPATAPSSKPAAAAEGTPLTAPMPGMIVSYAKEVGDSVAKGDSVVILEAMKMENSLPAPANGTIKAINYKSGDSVSKNDVLCIIG